MPPRTSGYGPGPRKAGDCGTGRDVRGCSGRADPESLSAQPQWVGGGVRHWCTGDQHTGRISRALEVMPSWVRDVAPLSPGYWAIWTLKGRGFGGMLRPPCGVRASWSRQVLQSTLLPCPPQP